MLYCFFVAKPLVDGFKSHLRNVKTSSFSDDEPAYDTVASDEDYSSLGDRASIKESTIIEHPELNVCIYCIYCYRAIGLLVL